MKTKNKIIITLAIIIMVAMYFGYTYYQNHKYDKFDLKQHFIQYYYQSNDNNSNYSFSAPSDTIYYLGNIESENATQNPHVWLQLDVGNDKTKVFDFMTLTNEQKLNDLNFCANIIKEYLESEKWNNNYQIVVSVNTVSQVPYNVCYIYKLNENNLYIPLSESKVVELYDRFKTFDYEELTLDENGKKYLMDNGYTKLNGDFDRNKIDEIIPDCFTAYCILGKYYEYHPDGSIPFTK